MTDSSRKGGTSKFMSQNQSQEMLGGSDAHIQSMMTLDGAGNPVPHGYELGMAKPVQKRIMTDQEKHAGWQECIVTHKQHIIK